MGKSLNQLWVALSMFFIALEKAASTLVNLFTWTDESSGTFVDEARIERQKKLAKLNAELAHEQANATANAAQATPAP